MTQCVTILLQLDCVLGKNSPATKSIHENNKHNNKQNCQYNKDTSLNINADSLTFTSEQILLFWRQCVSGQQFMAGRWFLEPHHIHSTIIWNTVSNRRRRSKRKWAITKCCLTMCRSIEGGMVYEHEWVLQECDGFFAAWQRYMMVQYCCDSGSTNKLFCMCFLLWQEANEVILNVWLYYMTLEGARLCELHSSVSVASGMSHHV